MVISIILAVVVLFYAAIYAWRVLDSLKKYKKAKANNDLIRTKATVIELQEPKAKKLNGISVILSYPVFRYYINDTPKKYYSSVKYMDVQLGDTREIAYSEKENMAWIENDLGSKKRATIIHVAVIIVFVIIMFLTELL